MFWLYPGPLNVGVRLHIEAPQLLLTAHAKDALRRYLSGIDEPSVAAVVWCLDGDDFNRAGELLRKRGPHWAVGIHPQSRVPSEWVATIDGISFVFDNADTARRLQSATLDFVRERFTVSERAI
jgi:hypothetical protein